MGRNGAARGFTRGDVGSPTVCTNSLIDEAPSQVGDAGKGVGVMAAEVFASRDTRVHASPQRLGQVNDDVLLGRISLRLGIIGLH